MGGSLYLPACLAPCVFVFVFHIKWEFSLCVGAWLLLVFGPLDRARLGRVCSALAMPYLISLVLVLISQLFSKCIYKQHRHVYSHITSKLYTHFGKLRALSSQRRFDSTKETATENFLPLTLASEALHSS